MFHSISNVKNLNSNQHKKNNESSSNIRKNVVVVNWILFFHIALSNDLSGSGFKFLLKFRKQNNNTRYLRNKKNNFK